MSTDKIVCKAYKGRCPLGGCENEFGPRKLSKSYDDPADIQRRVFNHLRFSSYHANRWTSDEEVIEYLEGDQSAWLVEEVEEWSQEEFDQMMQ